MPLLGKKTFTLGTQSLNSSAEDAPYLIPHTKERFQSKTEFEKRKDLYSQNIWTCRATGHTNLTHEEACKSEKVVLDQLKAQFPKCYEKSVLEIVHHSTSSLDSLVDQVWWKLHQELIPGEKVNLKVTIANKLIPAKIVSVDRSGTEAKDATSNCNSPSSDKENTAEEKEKSPKKWVPPKMLPYTYSIELENEAKVVHSVPGSDLLRQEKAPAKDLLRLFIRVSALRSWTASNSPWVVNSDLVSEYKLISKFADFFLSPAKMAEVSKRAEENGKKRKLSNGTPNSSSCKKLKLEKSSEKGIKKKKEKSTNKTKRNKDKKDSKDMKGSQKKKGTPSKNSTSPKKNTGKDVLVVSDSDSDDNMTLAKLKRNNSVLTVDSDSDTPLYQLAGQSTPKKKVKKKADKDADEDIPLSKMLSGSKKLAGLKKSGEKMKKNEKTPVKKKGKEDKKEGKKSPSKKASMKQVTLFDLTKKGKALLQQTPQKKSPQKVTKASPPKPPPTPAIVRRLLTARRETLHDKTKYSMLLKKAVNTLLPSQVKNLPEKLREEYERRKKLMDEKAKLEKMTPEQREEYLKEKREAAKRRQKQRVLEKLRDQRKRFEDNDLELIPLPEAKLVSTPDGFPNELFGEVAMVTEFINCYGGLLMPESEYPIFTDALMKALVGGSSGFTYLSRVLNVLLQTLLQDQIAKGYTELRTKISDIAVSAYTSSELVRLCLQCGEEEEEDEDVPEEYISLLKDSEFYQLELEQKLCLLRGLCSRVLSTYSVQDYMDDQQRKAFQLTKQKNVELKEIAAQKKSNKQSAVTNKSLNDSKSSKKTAEEEKKEENKDGSLSIASFYGKDAEDKGDEEEKNWGLIVKRRREAASQAAAEKERKERERAALAEKEYQKEREKERLRRKQEQIGEAILLARMVLRQDPIGTDRHHDRYWVFTNTTPGLYVEKGWMGQEVNYSVQSLQEKNATDVETSDDSSEEEEEQEAKPGMNQTGTTPLKVVYRTKKHFIEKSVPHAGQNLWLTYRSLKDLDGLIKALHPQGIRESVLRNEIKKRYDDICRAINQATRTNLELRDSDGDVEMVAGFKKELSDMELRLRNGGLGGVPDYEDWEARLMEATEISVMGECLLEVKAGILDKFFQGFMKPVTKAENEEPQADEANEDGVKKEEDEESEEDKPPEKEDKHERAVREWQESIESCQTMSRLHVLMAMLDSCVKWEKSAENAKCKICRKKCDDDRLLLCDECNQAFHMYCLRPALNKLPSGDWFCPACKPRRPQVRPLESESEEEEEDKETACRECGGEEKLMVCSKCPAAFHTQCHQPPLRHPPRGVWECSDCKNGISGRRKGRFARKAAPKRNYRQQVVSEDDEEEEESEEEEEEEQQKTRSRSSRSRGYKENGHSAKKTPQSGRSSRSRNHSAQESSSVVTPTGRSSRRGPSELSLCEEVLVRVMKHKSSWPFLEPVDKKLVPDYHSLIKKPMDFQTMQKKCARLSYASPQEFIEDAALVFENAEAYNKPDSDVFMCMREVEKVFKDLLQKQLPDWPYYRTVIDKEESSSGSENGRKRSRSKY